MKRLVVVTQHVDPTHPALAATVPKLRALASQLGVVDENSRVHGTSNLYVTGSSVFPSGGYANPTLTIVALAARLGDHLKRVTSPHGSA